MATSYKRQLLHGDIVNNFYKIHPYMGIATVYTHMQKLASQLQLHRSQLAIHVYNTFHIPHALLLGFQQMDSRCLCLLSLYTLHFEIYTSVLCCFGSSVISVTHDSMQLVTLQLQYCDSYTYLNDFDNFLMVTIFVLITVTLEFLYNMKTSQLAIAIAVYEKGFLNQQPYQHHTNANGLYSKLKHLHSMHHM